MNPTITPDTGIVADAVDGHWADRYLPRATRPYARLARLERPIGWWLLAWPCWWSVALASLPGGAAVPDLKLLALFVIGAIAMRGAGCTWNDLTDRDIDAMVERTASRPIPSGQTTPRAAAIFMVVQALVGLVVLLQFNTFTIWLGLGSLIVVAIYPFMKRITDWPQVVLGLAFNWGALVGWSAVTGGLSAASVALYIAGIAFTVGYDTIYACQDKEDDAIVGVRSTARLFGRHARVAVAGFYLLTLVLMAAAFGLAGAGTASFIGLAAFALHLGWQVKRLNPDDPDLCLMLFRSNRDAGWLLFFGLCADLAVKRLMA